VRLLKKNGRAAVVLPDGTLFGEGVKARGYNLDTKNPHTIGPLSALSAAIMTFAVRLLRDCRLAFTARAAEIGSAMDTLFRAAQSSAVKELADLARSRPDPGARAIG